MALMLSFDQVGSKRDISETLSNISPTKVPFQTLIGKEMIEAVKHEWQTMSLVAANSGNAAIQGATAPVATFSLTTVRDNLTQILTSTVGVSGTLAAIKAHGRKTEMALQLANRAWELKRDFEVILLSNQVRVVGNAATASKMDSAQVLISAGHKFHAADSTTTLNPGALAAFNETALMTANEVLYADGGEATILMLKPKDGRVIAGFASATGRLRDMRSESKIVNVVEVYISPFGEQKVVLNRFQRTADAFLFDPANWAKLVLRPWTRETLAKTGDSTNIQIVGEFSLKHENPDASALITDLN